MRESFLEYKKTIEQNLINIGHLYSGDIISSVSVDYAEIKDKSLTSPSFIINTIVDIYNKSFQKMMDRSKEIIIPIENLKENFIFNEDILCKNLDINPAYIFCSESDKLFFGPFTKNNLGRPLPDYLYCINEYFNIHSEVFYSPFIKENPDEIVMYVVDAPIQGLVYSIQNMDYQIEPISYKVNEVKEFIPNITSKWRHKMTYNLYDCKFNSYKVCIREVSKIRNDKINKILNDC
jgi:hypothetical protein